MDPNFVSIPYLKHGFLEVFLIRGGGRAFYGKYDKFWQLPSKTEWNDSASAKESALLKSH